MDLMPTILELAGVDESGMVFQGESLVDLVEGRRLADWESRIVVSEEPVDRWKHKPFRDRGLFVFGSLLYRDWHLIASRRFWPMRGYVPEGLRMKVFDFVRDPGENRQLYRFFFDLYLRYEFLSLLNELQSSDLEAHMKWTGGKGGGSFRYDPDTLERLRALGYVG